MGTTSSVQPLRKLVSTKQQRIAEIARLNKDAALCVSHRIDLEWLLEAWRRTRKDGALGVDGMDSKTYQEDLKNRLQTLLEQAKSGLYRAPPVRRVHIPKGNGKETRPLGIPTLEDKVLQRAIEMALTPIYEQDFLPCSYGFRPKRSAHQALQTVWNVLMQMGGGFVVDLDIRNYFGAVSHKIIQEMLSKRVRDGVVKRLIGKWLNAGIQEEGQLHYPESGVPQGGVISPLLSNIYLHEVLDTWFTSMVTPVMKGKCHIVRFADDALLIFESKNDAERVFKVLPKRFAKYGLTLHPDKTKLVDFRPETKGSSFSFLGFTHVWGKSRKGWPVVKRRTMKERLARAIKSTGQWLQKERHLPIQTQHKMLSLKIRGHIQYYGITGNSAQLATFVYQVKRLWRYWLSKRSSKAKKSWEWFSHVLNRYPLPKPTPVHSIYCQS